MENGSKPSVVNVESDYDSDSLFGMDPGAPLLLDVSLVEFSSIRNGLVNIEHASTSCPRYDCAMKALSEIYVGGMS